MAACIALNLLAPSNQAVQTNTHTPIPVRASTGTPANESDSLRLSTRLMRHKPASFGRMAVSFVVLVGKYEAFQVNRHDAWLADPALCLNIAPGVQAMLCYLRLIRACFYSVTQLS